MYGLSAVSEHASLAILVSFCLILLSKYHVTQSKCECCLRVEDPCQCINVRFGHFSHICGHSIPNLTNLIKIPFIHVEKSDTLTPGLYTLLALDTEVLHGPDHWHKAHLVLAGWNIEYHCLIQSDGCNLLHYLPVQTADCSDNYDRYDPLRIILLLQKDKITRQFWGKYKKTRLFSYAELYNRALYKLPPVRMSEYQIRYCAHHPKYDQYLLTKYITTSETGCQFSQISQKYLRNSLLQKFPKVQITQSDVDLELGDCYIQRDWNEKPKRARSEKNQRARQCPFNLMKFVLKMNASSERKKFTQHMIKRIGEWYWLSSVEYMHLMGIKESSDVYGTGEPGFDVHSAYCGSFLRQKKKTAFCLARTEAYRQILLQLGVIWNPKK